EVRFGELAFKRGASIDHLPSLGLESLKLAGSRLWCFDNLQAIAKAIPVFSQFLGVKGIRFAMVLLGYFFESCRFYNSMLPGIVGAPTKQSLAVATGMFTDDNCLLFAGLSVVEPLTQLPKPFGIVGDLVALRASGLAIE